MNRSFRVLLSDARGIGNTSTFGYHMKTKHAAKIATQDGASRTANASSLTSQRQISLQASFSNMTPYNSRIQLSKTRKLLEMLIIDMQPFHMVEREGFRNVFMPAFDRR